MKKLILTLSLIASNALNAQTLTASFESFTLQASSAYSPAASVPFYEAGIKFNHNYSGGYWLGGFAYSNIKDSSTAGYTNLYGVKPLNGYNNSSIHCIGQDGAVLSFSQSPAIPKGFYVTNTTYAYKSMKLGDSFAKKFGGSTGNDPDFFKIVVKSYKSGTFQDSVSVFLANFTFTNNSQDFIVDTWQYVDLSALGQCDSLKFVMRSSDMSSGFINTPLFFALDNFSYEKAVSTDIEDVSGHSPITLYPNPATSLIKLNNVAINSSYSILDINGRIVQEGQLEQGQVNLNAMNPGLYFLKVYQLSNVQTLRFVKQ